MRTSPEFATTFPAVAAALPPLPPDRADWGHAQASHLGPRSSPAPPLGEQPYAVANQPVYGFALQQINIPLRTPEQVAEVGQSILGQLAAEYPHLAEMIIDHAMQPGYGCAEEFEFALDLILDGLERLRQ
jgi:hypothetical protein